MKLLSLLILIVLLVPSFTNARTHDGYTSYDNYREIGDERLWTVIIKDTVIGSLRSEVIGQFEKDGAAGFEIKQILKLDFTQIHINSDFKNTGSHFVAVDGGYVGDNLIISVNGEEQTLTVSREGDNIVGTISRGGEDFPQNIALKQSVYPFETNFFDQYESFLAAQTFSVGDSIITTVYSPHTFSTLSVSAFVEDFRNIRLYNEVFDSCFVIQFTQPIPMTVYFSPQNRLKKVDMPSQRLKAYQDMVRNNKKMQAALENLQKEKLRKITSKSVPETIGIWALYLLFGLVALLMIAYRQFGEVSSYIYFVGGSLLFVVVPLTQIPLQMYLFEDIYLPAVADEGGSPLWYGLLPALAGGIIQETLKLIGIILLGSLLHIQNRKIVAYAAFAAVGFGIIEACYLVGNFSLAQLTGINLAERAFTILFHGTAGFVLGFGIWKRGTILWQAILATIFLNSFIRYLPIFVQSKTTTPELLTVGIGFIAVLMLLGIIILQKKYLPDQKATHSAR